MNESPAAAVHSSSSIAGVSVGRFVADLVVDRKVIVETKVAKAIDPVRRAQVSNYLRASRLEVGPVINFESSVQFKRVIASPARARAAERDTMKGRKRANDLTRINHDHYDDAD